MSNSLRSQGSRFLNVVRRRLGNSQKGRPFSEFISFNDTQKAAKAAGVSVGEFLERRHVVGNKTALEVTFEGLTALGVFDGKLDRICEIGPGSGRYLEKTMSLCNPAHYEIYETSAEWRKWLAEKYGVTTRQSDWRTLGETEAASVDLVQAHKVFPGLPLLTTISYFREMARVARNGGWIVFDVMTETCFDVVNLQAWFDANPWEWEWSPRMCSFEYVVNMFESLGVTAIGNFLVPLYPGVTQCLVFRKTIPQEKLSNPVKSGR